MQNRAWVFTIFNYALLREEERPENWAHCRYCIYQLERCPDTHRLHWQGYIYFDTKMSLAACKELHTTCHFAIRKGSHEEARDYCKKHESRIDGPWEFGEEPKAGQRNDILAVKESIVFGLTEEQLWELHFPMMIKFHRAFLYYRTLIIPPRDFKTNVVVLYGPTGTGKTLYLAQNLPKEEVFFLNRARSAGDPWLDFYDPLKHHHIILDDFYGWIRWDTLLRMLDRYPFKMETKGGQIQFRPSSIWITSNKRPEEWYDLTTQGRSFETLLRRINVIRKYTGPDTYIEERHVFDAPLPTEETIEERFGEPDDWEDTYPLEQVDWNMLFSE